MVQAHEEKEIHGCFNQRCERLTIHDFRRSKGMLKK